MAWAGPVNQAVRRLPNWAVYIGGAFPVIWLFWQAVQNRLGADPVKAIEHQMGLWALWLLIAGLAITPLMRFTPLRLVKLRRPIGVLAFAYLLVHFLVWLVLDVQILSQVWADILKRPYITVGLLALVLLMPLALTSNNLSLRRLGGARWRAMHRLVYLAVPLAGIHMMMQAKGLQLEPILYLSAIIGVLALRLIPRARRAAPQQA